MCIYSIYVLFYFNGYFAFSAQYLIKQKEKKNISDMKIELADLLHNS